MAYSGTLAYKGIKRRSPRMAKKGCEDAVAGHDMRTIREAIESFRVQGP